MRHKGLLVPLSRWYLWRVIPGGPGRSLLQSWHLKDGVGFDYSARRERLTTTSTCSTVVTTKETSYGGKVLRKHWPLLPVKPGFDSLCPYHSQLAGD